MMIFCDFEDKQNKELRCKRMRPQTLMVRTVKNVSDIEIYVCDVCGTPSLIPQSSIRPLLDGLITPCVGVRST